jgi:hypothetical protein
MKLRFAQEDPAPRPRSIEVEEAVGVMGGQLLRRRTAPSGRLERDSKQMPADSSTVGDGLRRQVRATAQMERRPDLLGDPTLAGEQRLGTDNELPMV